ncbi:hypothetical protein BJP40_12035 [Streptomyces sp. CC53]|uniref:hypothetical protein n=1 Tax=Streptomyces sp. CC53 TaxID=1906740 RepID=UPI0008DCB4C4|nr:hypothetical protein [Streptomyces sp. CC53]OII59993.1 hypothetical protein BJP40_12035 [Streptomyces sp. CC53]
MNNAPQTPDADITEAEVEEATARVHGRFLEPMSRATGQDARFILHTIPDDVHEAAVIAYVMAERIAQSDPAVSVDTAAAVLFFAQLRETPGCATFLALYYGQTRES